MATLGSSNTVETTAGALVQGSVSAIFLTFIQDAIKIMIPYLVMATVLIVADLYFGVRAAHIRGERIRVPKLLRMTISKVFEYACWVIVSAALSERFGGQALIMVILGFVFGIELISIVTNWATIHGYKISGLKDALLKAIGKKVDVDLSDVRIEEDPKKGEKINDNI